VCTSVTPVKAQSLDAEVFGKLPGVYDAALSPDGGEVAAIVNAQGRYAVGIFSKGAQPRVIGLGKGVKPASIKWANNQRVLVSLWQSDRIQGTPVTTGYIYTLDTQNMKGRFLIRPKGIVRQYNNVIVDWLDNDPDHILMAFSDEDNNNLQPDIKRVNVATGRYVTVQRGLRDIQWWITDATGAPRIGQGYKDNSFGTAVMRIRDTQGARWRSADDYPGLSANTRIHGFTQNPDEVIISAYRGKDTVGLYIYDLAAKAVTRKIYHNDKYDASGVVFNSDSGEVIGARYTAEASETELLGEFDTSLARMRRQLPDYTIDYVDQSSDGKTVLFKVSNPYDPGALMILRAGQEMPSRLGYTYPDVNSNQLGDVISLTYRARDKVKIPAFVTLPPTVTETSQIKNLPFIVLPHGGPYGRDSKRFDYFAQFFATRGYGVLQMNFRGSDGYGKAYKEAGRKNWVVMQEDVEDGTRWLQRKGYADPKRTCIVGWSYGGYAALMGAAKNGDLYNCAVAMAALTDIKDFKRDARKYRFGKAGIKNFIGEGFESKDDIKANSPVKIAGDIKIPLFLAHGTADQRVHFDQYRRMKSALKKSPAKVTYMEFRDEDHFLSNQANRQKFLKGVEKFLMDANGKSEFMPE